MSCVGPVSNVILYNFESHRRVVFLVVLFELSVWGLLGSRPSAEEPGSEGGGVTLL